MLFCFRLGAALFPPVDADVGTSPSVDNQKVEEANEDNESAESESDSEVDEGQMKKKPKKEKVGFRERKVQASFNY